MRHVKEVLRNLIFGEMKSKDEYEKVAKVVLKVIKRCESNMDPIVTRYRRSYL